MGTTRIGHVVATLCAATVILLGVPAVAHAAPTIGGYSVRPVEIDEKDPATRAYFKPVLKPGSNAKYHVEVKNLNGASLHLLIDSVDGVTGQTSGAVYANRQDTVSKAGAWVVPSTHVASIAPRGTAIIGLTVRVPEGATPGDHLAGIAFENAASNSSGGGFAVKEVVREVVGIQIRVPGPASEHLTIGALALQSLPGTSFASVIVNLSNVGQLLCKPALTVALDGPNGSARTVTRMLDTVLPGDSIAYPLPWPERLPAGRYIARASTTACGPEAATGDVPLALGAPLNGSEQPVQIPARTLRLPSLSTILTVVLVLAGLLLGLLIGKRRRREEESELQPVPAYVRIARLEAPAALATEGVRRVRTLEPPPQPVRTVPLERRVALQPSVPSEPTVPPEPTVPLEQPAILPSTRPEQQSLWP